MISDLDWSNESSSNGVDPDGRRRDHGKGVDLVHMLVILQQGSAIHIGHGLCAKAYARLRHTAETTWAKNATDTTTGLATKKRIVTPKLCMA